ncbi:hypothetical protein [Sphingomonas sp.]|uniref:hypothetical protein n=1 Tax=Sphingomonas sp. TaxID=28214 RepID=UPI003B3A4A71
MYRVAGSDKEQVLQVAQYRYHYQPTGLPEAQRRHLHRLRVLHVPRSCLDDLALASALEARRFCP